MGWLSLPEGGDFQTWSRDFTEAAYVGEKTIDQAVYTVTKSLDSQSSLYFASQAELVQQHYAVRFWQTVDEKNTEVESELGPLLWECLGKLHQKAAELVPKEHQTEPIKALHELDNRRYRK